jgi:predicted ArsR family transcriptional regulator
MTRQPESATRKRVRELTTSGLTPRQIADALRISTQAVYRHLKALNLNGKRAS